MSGRTFLFDTSSKVVYTGTFSPSTTQTAHSQLGDRIGANNNPCNFVGGSIKSDGSVAFRSETFNNPCYNQCDMAGTSYASDITNQLNKRQPTNYIFK